MRKPAKALVITIAVIIFIFLVWCFPVSHPQVIGKLSSNDLNEIEHQTWRELRFWILPKLEWDNIYHLGYVFSSISEYEAQRILWIDVKPDGSVEVFVGVSKNVILSEGHVIDLRKDVEWKITGYGYWASSNVAPHDIHVPR